MEFFQESLVYLNDIFPTITDLIGIEKPQTVDGKSLLTILENPNISVRNSVFLMYKNF